jgi:protein involved in polysaccharide export with SLBB domain
MGNGFRSTKDGYSVQEMVLPQSKIQLRVSGFALWTLLLSLFTVLWPAVAQSQNKNSRPAVRGSAIRSTLSDYRLGTGDILSVIVARHPEMSAEEVTVNTSGRVSLPVVGSVLVTGKTVNQVANEVRTKLVKALRRPEVTVTLKQARPRAISILGAVERPGVYDWKPGWRVSDALATAGGLNARNELVEATLSRARQRAVVLDLNTLLRDPADSANVVLEGGDTLRFVSRVAQVSVAGQVKNPGSFTVPLGSSVLEVIALAGGANPNAALTQTTIRRRNDPVPQTLDLLEMMAPGKVDAAPRVEDGDLIVIPESRARISVVGAVQNPGTFNLEEKSTLRLAGAIALAGGLTGAPGASRVVMSRIENGQPRSWNVDASGLLERNDPALNEVVQDGDLISIVAVSRKVFINGEVKTPGAYDIKEGDTVPKLIALAGGTTETAAQTRVTVKRGAETFEVNARAGTATDFPLQDGDLVSVPKNTARVLVLGAVNKPGAVPIEENTTLRLGEAIGLAGGARDRARVKEIGIFRTTPQGVQRTVVSLDKVVNGQPGLDHPLQNGDRLYVPEGRQSTSFWDQIARVVTVLTIF